MLKFKYLRKVILYMAFAVIFYYLWHIYQYAIKQSFPHTENLDTQSIPKVVKKVATILPDTVLKTINYNELTLLLRYKTIKDQYVSQIVLCDARRYTEKVLVQAVENDTILSTPITYAKSDDYPFPTLGEITDFLLSPDKERIYLETTAWAVSNATHYYEFSSGKIHFFHSGDLAGIQANGMVEIIITEIETFKDETTCRYWQTCLFNKNGKKIKALETKVY